MVRTAAKANHFVWYFRTYFLLLLVLYALKKKKKAKILVCEVEMIYLVPANG